MPRKKSAEPRKPGPDPDTLHVEGDWEVAVRHSLAKKRPAKGWPKPKKKGKGR